MTKTTKNGFALEAGDVLAAGRIVAVGTLAVWFGVLIRVTVANQAAPVYFEPAEIVALKCCDGASRDCLVHGDGN